MIGRQTCRPGSLVVLPEADGVGPFSVGRGAGRDPERAGPRPAGAIRVVNQRQAVAGERGKALKCRAVEPRTEVRWVRPSRGRRGARDHPEITGAEAAFAT